ncbi:CoA transferase [Bradyrhizobium roseum]|uniref:CoA transferase n=1 Tax=Bradyrhizobium roseum TaxID=3056648 RepID=UPI00262D9D4E|nr:CoA transferase [Bradyrhizobium roseus]WKA26528.1 CoA transferase [Bradyrhizobium roseus]
MTGPAPSHVEPALISQRLGELLSHCGIVSDLTARIDLDGAAPGCRPAVGEGAAVVLAACAIAAAEIWLRRGGKPQPIAVSTRQAAATLRSYAYLTLDGHGVGGAPSDESPLAEFYRTRDGRHFFIHGVLPHLAAGTLKVLGLDTATYDSVAHAVSGWDALDLEEALATRGMCGVYARTPAEWDAHAQNMAIAPGGPVELLRIGDAPPEPLPAGSRPLEGVRVLDLTRILAGPTCGRTLAEHGADVLLVSSPKLDSVHSFVLDTGHGKRSTWLDLTHTEDRSTLKRLVAQAHIFSQGYRSGSLARRGFSPNELAAIRPGLICISINCYGHEGPWVERPGWDQLAAAATGLTEIQGEDSGRPALLRSAACDYVTGYLGALGAIAALQRRATEGGSWLVRVSLAQTGVWLRDFAAPRALEDRPDFAVPDDYFVETQTPFGRLKHLAPAARMGATQPHWERPVVPLGTHPPSFSDANAALAAS